MKTHRIYIVPTLQGLLAILSSLLIIMIGAIYSSSVVFLFAFMIFAFSFIALLSTHRIMSSSEFEKPVCDGIFADTVGFMDLKIRPPEPTEFRVRVGKDQEQKFHLQTAGQIALPIHVSKRGLHKVKTLRIGTSSPTGLFYSWVIYRINLEIPVFPKPEGRLNIEELGAGEFQPTHVMGDEFSYVRKFHDSEPFHRINWPRYGKTGTLYVNEFQGEQIEDLQIDFDKIPLKDNEDKLKQMSQWIVELDRKRIPFAIKVRDHRTDVSTGFQHRLDCLRLLAEFE